MSYFPLKIIYTVSQETVVVQKPEDIISGKGFRVLETNTES